MPIRSAVAAALACLLGAAPAVSQQLTQKGKALSAREVERRLDELGFAPGPVDGVFDARTEAALRAFQRKAGVPETGATDEATMAELVASGEDKMLHRAPAALLPANTARENFGTRVILRPAADRPGAIVLVVPRRGGYVHKLQFLGLTDDGRAHVESTVWSQGAVHELDEPITLAGFAFAPAAGQTLVFRVDRRKGYVFVSGQGTVTAPAGAPLTLGPEQRGLTIGQPPRAPQTNGASPPRK